MVDPRLLYKYYSSPEPGMRSFADRTAVNSPIQGDVHPDTRIRTNHGYLTIKSLLKKVKLDSTEEFKKLRVWNGTEYVKFGLYEHPANPIKRITIASGESIDAGSNHLFKVVDDNGIRDVHRDDLTTDDFIVTSAPEIQPGLDDSTLLTEDFHEIGFLLGSKCIATTSPSTVKIPSRIFKLFRG